MKAFIADRYGSKNPLRAGDVPERGDTGRLARAYPRSIAHQRAVSAPNASSHASRQSASRSGV